MSAARRGVIVPPRRSAPSHQSHREIGGLDRALLVFLILHIPVGLVLDRLTSVAMLHAVASVLVGVFFALVRPRMDMVLCSLAYIAGAEVLWRVAQAGPLYEFGKYSTIGICLVAIFRQSKVQTGLPLAAAFILLLLPSSALTLQELPLDEARRLLSFNLAGPVAIALSVVLFSNVRLNAQDRIRILVAALAPIVGLAAVTLFSTATATDLSFTGSANKITSGGFGPNQVANTLGFGALVAVILVGGFISRLRDQAVLLAIAIWLASSSAMTFSRGGLYSAVLGGFGFAFYSMRSAKARGRLLVATVSLVIVAAFVLVPALDSFTRGKLTERFESTSTTGRDTIAQVDIEVWMNNFILGVGPGMAVEAREDSAIAAVAHTEYTRMLAEHGIFGFLAIVVLAVICGTSVLRTTTVESRALSCSLAIWALTIMVHSALRLVSPAFAIGFACAGNSESASEEAGGAADHGKRKPTIYGATPWQATLPERPAPR